MASGFAAIGLIAAMNTAAPAAAFRLDVREDASASDFEATLRLERAHRRGHPDDEIVIALPAHLARTIPIALGPEDSGRAGAPLVLRGAAGEGTTITGAVVVDSEARPDLSEALRARLPSGVADRVRRWRPDVAWLAATTPAFAAIGSFAWSGPGRLIVYEGQRRLQPARWPPQGYLTSPVVLPQHAPGHLAVGLPTPVVGLQQEMDFWVEGFWGWNWWFERRRASAPAAQTVEVDKPDAPIRASARYRLFNVAAGLDRSGVYYRDAEDGALYFLPDADDRDGRLSIAVADGLLRIRGAAHMRIENIAFEKTIGVTASIEDSSDVVLSDCYVGQAGTTGVVISGGDNDRIENCVVDDVGYGGVAIGGGDRATLTPGRQVLGGSYIARFGRELPTYRPGVSLQGVGNRVEDCEIAFGPHAGLIFGGNDQVIAGNLFHDLALDSDDAGAIYSGRNWTMRGAVIEANGFRDIQNKIDASPVVGVYLDDQMSGATVIGNIFQRVDEPILVGGGRENLIRDNLLLDWRRGPIAVDSRGLTWEADMAKPGGALMRSLDAVPFRSAVWTARYPGLATLPDDRPGAPVGNVVADNLSDRTPVVAYDNPQTATYGEERGSRMVAAQGADFSAALAGIPADAPAAPLLRAAAARIAATERAMPALRFRARAGQ